MRTAHALCIVLAGLLFGGCRSREDSSAPEDSAPPADTLVVFDSTAVDTEIRETILEADADSDPIIDAVDATVTDDADSDAAADTGDGAAMWPPVCVPVSTDAESPDGDATTCTATRVRIVAANLTSGNFQRYEPPGIRILQGLHPDIVLVQEMNYAGALRDFVDVTFGTTFHYVVETGPGIPNGVVSRYPIVASGEWDDPDLTDRDFAWARIDIPGPIDLWTVSVHLRTAGSVARDTEARKLVEYVKANVPSGDYLVIGGDLNTETELEPALATLAGVVVIAPPYAIDQAGNNKTNSTRAKPYDWLLPTTSLHARMIPVRIGAAEFPSGLVLDTRVFMPLTDVAPALATDSSALSMQHMAVVRDFAFAGP
jgi:hypothetical protein